MMNTDLRAEIAAWRARAAQYPPLTAQEETDLFTAWWERNDVAARDRILAAHMRLTVAMACRHIGYGLPLADMISEGSIGLLEALKRFKPDMGARFSTFAYWWIRSKLSDYVLENWSSVRTGGGTAHKRLFFGLRRTKRELGYHGALDREQAAIVADRINAPVEQVLAMDFRLAAADVSLNQRLGDTGDGIEMLDLEIDPGPPVEDRMIEAQIETLGSSAIAAAMDCLNDRERHVLTARRLREEPITLRSLAEDYGLSVERVRQIEVAAFSKLSKRIRGMMPERGLRSDDLVPAA